MSDVLVPCADCFPKQRNPATHRLISRDGVEHYLCARHAETLARTTTERWTWEKLDARGTDGTQ